MIIPTNLRRSNWDIQNLSQTVHPDAIALF